MNVYDLTIPVFTGMLRNLSKLLERAEEQAASRKFAPEALLDARLYPDMFPLTRQVQLATDFAKGTAARLAAQDVPKWDDTERGFAELQARISKALDYLATIAPAAFDDAESRAIELKTPAGTFHFRGDEFLLTWGLPNFYFHVTTAYNILRHNGIEIGKLDFLGKA
ncbi:MAG: DUF1993 domain-containing protein [Gammaproteobacteria bacterium]|nr:DUF1993 domain-containing protein [Gammaproteobacteria bacterium]MBI5616258.1 DUF1993 domain-containing protein [Gammaproteobacteria bacterium]